MSNILTKEAVEKLLEAKPSQIDYLNILSDVVHLSKQDRVDHAESILNKVKSNKEKTGE